MLNVQLINHTQFGNYDNNCDQFIKQKFSSKHKYILCTFYSTKSISPNLLEEIFITIQYNNNISSFIFILNPFGILHVECK